MPAPGLRDLVKETIPSSNRPLALLSATERRTDVSSEVSIEEGRSARPTRATDWPALVWRVWTSPHVTMVALLWLSGLIGLSQIIPQSPYSLDEPLVYSQWFAKMPPFLWPLVDDLRALGFFQLRTSAWLRLPLAVLLLHALAVCTSALPVAWQRTRARSEPARLLARSPDETPPALGRPLGLAVWRAAAAEHVFAHTMQQLAQDGYTVRGDPRAQVGLAWRRHLGWWALCSLYVGLALLAMGLLLHSWLGRAYVLRLQPGQATTVPGLPELVLWLEDTRIVGDPLAPSEGVVQVRHGEAESGGAPITLPLHAGRMIGGMWWTVVDITPMVEVTAQDAQDGETLELWSFVPRAHARPRARLSLADEEDASFVSLPARNVTLRFGRASEPHASPGQLTLSFFRGVETAPMGTATLSDGDEVLFEGVRYQASLSHDVQLRVQQGAWWIMAALGWLGVALGGGSLTWCRPIWLVVRTEDAAGGCRMTIWVDTLAPHSPPLERLRTLGG